MPNRLIKDSIYESDKISKLDDFQFRVWVALITYVDDFGRGDARPAIIKGRCFPLRRSVKEEDIACALCDLADAKCIHLYTVHGKPYLCFPTWSKHQNIRNQRSKYPSPDEADADSQQQIASDCERLKSTAGKCPRNPIQSNTTKNPNPNPTMNPKEEVEGGGGIENPYSEITDHHRQNFDTVEIYASSNLRSLSPRNLEELQSFKEDLPEELIRYAIDEACANGNPVYGYVRSILNRYLDQGFKTVGEVKAYEQERKKKGGRNGNNRRGSGQGAGEYQPLFDGETVV